MYCRMLPLEHSAILLTCIKGMSIIGLKINFGLLFEWLFKTGFTLCIFIWQPICFQTEASAMSYVGCLVSLDCGDSLGTYQGQVKNIDNSSQLLTICHAFRNGVKCEVPEITIR